MTDAQSIFTIRRARYWRTGSCLAGALALTTVLSLGGCGGGGGQKEAAVDRGPVDYGSGGAFPVPPEIEPNVNFWRNVYGVWGRHQVAFHDDEHMGVIYEVADLPGPTQEGYSEQQRAFVRDRLEYYKDQVRDLERRLAGNETLSPQQQSLLNKFEQDGGARGVYGAAERVRSQRGLRDRFRRGLEISGRYDRAFREVMRSNGLPEDLAYLPHVESSFQTNAVSSAGATGVWQFMPATGRSFMNVNGAVDDRMDPILSAQGAARYLSQAHHRLGSWPLAITSYNHGQGGMANAKAQYGQDFGRIVKNYQGKSFKFASRNYYAEFIAAREVAGHPARYFPEGLRYESPWPHERLVLASSTPADQVARHYGLSTGNLASLNMHWRGAARDGHALLPAGSTVWLPAGSMSRVPGQPSADGFGLASRATPTPVGEPLTAAAASMAFKVTGAEPVFAELPPRTPPVAPPQPNVAKVEPHAASWDESETPLPVAAKPEPKASLAQSQPKQDPVPEEFARREPTPEPRLAKPAPRSWVSAPDEARPQPRLAHPEPKYAKSESKSAKAEPKVDKAPPKVAKVEAKTAKTDTKATKVDAKTAKADTKAAKVDARTAKADAKAAKGDAKTAKADARTTKVDAKTAKADAKADKAGAKTAKAEKSEGSSASSKFHVVKPQETLFRVASGNGITVAELRRLNKLGPNDNSVRPGQKLKVGT